jgi:hypothetical protein
MFHLITVKVTSLVDYNAKKKTIKLIFFYVTGISQLLKTPYSTFDETPSLNPENLDLKILLASQIPNSQIQKKSRNNEEAEDKDLIEYLKVISI